MKEKFKQVVFETLEKLVKEGIDKKLIEAAININEFHLREAEEAGYPKGLMYGIEIMDSWLYGKNPSMHLEYEENLNKIKEALQNDYFEKIIEKYLLNNAHSALLVVKPKKGLLEEKEREVQKKLVKYKAQLSKEEIEQLINETKKLGEMQTTPDSKENLNSIPLLSLEDIDTEPEELPLIETKERDIDLLIHPLFTNSIAYVHMYFDLSSIPENLLPYASLLSQVLGKIDTEQYSYEDLSNEINIHTGGIQYGLQAFGENGTDDQYYPKFIVNSKALVDKIPKLHSLINEMVTKTKFEDDKRLKEIIQETVSRLERRILSQGHAVVANRLYSYFSPIGNYLERLQGIDYYQFLCGLESDFEGKNQR
jgi:hypothetical protein